MSHLALFLLGPPRVERNGLPLDITRRKATALLAYLAVSGQSHTRDSLAALLWPEYDQRRARADLRRILSVLNKALNGDWLNTEGDRVSLKRHAGFWLDVTYFERRLAERDSHHHPPNEICAACLSSLTEAVTVYKNDFMAGFSLTDSVNFDEWQFFQSERLRKALIEALERLADGYSSQGEFSTALDYARRRATLDPLHEGAHRQLMRLYSHIGQRAAALRQFQLCRQILEDELGVSPSEPTKTLYHQIRSGQWQQPASSAASRLHPAPAAAGHNLPAQPTPFIGRRHELDEIAQRLADSNCHLLTLSGPGGIGKTRLALEAASQALAGGLFPDGVYFVPLSPLSRADSLVSMIGQALQVSFYSPESFADDPRDQLLDYLQTRQLLLIMDNFEHLLPPSPTADDEHHSLDLLIELLQSVPGIKVIVTSQERLNIQAEWVLEIEGMRIPKKDEPGPLEDYSAIRLFLQHAHRVQADFKLTKADEPHLIRICQLVGGMPLGLQLAATWVRQLSCRDIVRELENNLDFLETSQRDVPERQRSFRAVFAHSWTLLSAEEQRACRQLSVFQGKFRRTAAEQIAEASLPLLSSLTDKSFLHKTASGRYEMHQVLRQYAAEKLRAAHREEAQTRHRACDFYVTFLQRKTNALRGPKQIQALAVMGEEIGNLRASWQWAVTQQKLAAIEQFVDGLYNFYELRGWVSEGVAIFGQAVETLTGQSHPDADDEAWVLMLAMIKAREGALRSRLGHTKKARRLLQDTLAVFRRQEEAREIAFAANHLGMVMRRQGYNQQARTLWQESLHIYRRFEQPWGVGWSLNMLGHLAGALGHYEEARQLLQESLSIRQKIGNRRGMAGSLTSLGYVIFLLGEYEEAKLLLEEALAIRREIGYRRGVAVSLNYLGRVAAAMNRHSESKCYFIEALTIVMDIRNVPLGLDILVGLAAVFNEEGDTDQAAALLQFPLHHPAAARETRDKAETLATRLAPGMTETSPVVDWPHLEAVVAQLLAAHAA